LKYSFEIFLFKRFNFKNNLYFISSMGMSSYSMANNMNANSCLQQQAAAAAAASSYSCMLPPGPGRGYDPITLGGYSRPSCPSAAQVHAMQTVNGQFAGVNNPTTSTGIYAFYWNNQFV
jgi:hypothetical protein